MDQRTAEGFSALHVKGSPLILVNVWDAGSAATVTAAGAKAIATSSWAVASAAGRGDGEVLSLGDSLRNLARIVAATALPVSIDLERGYHDLVDSVSAAAVAGAVGANIEDGTADGIRDVGEQADRLAKARAAVPGFFLNARTDLFLQAPASGHAELIESALDRAAAYREAGADGFFVPGLTDPELIERIVRATPLPVNVMAGESGDVARFSARGVARISFGAAPYRAMTAALTSVAQDCLQAQAGAGDQLG